MTDYNNRRWNKKMTIAEMLPLMSDAEIDRNARRGGLAAIEEQKRRQAPSAKTAAAIMAVFKSPTLLVPRAEILGDRHGSYADRVLPDHDLDLGV